MKSLSVIGLALLLVAPAAFADKRPTPLPGQEKAVADALWPCPLGLERFLPGEYYFCYASEMYWSGHPGVARESLKDAAAWSSKPAMYALGIMYYNGDTATKNRPLGLAWLALAAERHNPEYEAAFISAYRSLSPEEMAQANAYWKEMKPKYADKVAAARAEKRFDRAYADLGDAMLYGGTIFVSGLTSSSDTLNTAGGSQVSNAFSLSQLLLKSKTEFLYGYNSHVYVGDAELVPISSVAQRSDRESKDPSIAPGGSDQ